MVLDGAAWHVGRMKIPGAVRSSAYLWGAAVVAGVLESAMAIVNAAKAGPLGQDVWGNVALRCAVYLLAASLLVAFRRGKRWARTTLTVLLTVIGLATLVLPAVAAMADGQGFVAAFGDDGRLGSAFAVVRLTHIGCVVLASVLMYTATANGYFGTRGGRRKTLPAKETAPVTDQIVR